MYRETQYYHTNEASNYKVFGFLLSVMLLPRTPVWPHSLTHSLTQSYSEASRQYGCLIPPLASVMLLPRTPIGLSNVVAPSPRWPTHWRLGSSTKSTGCAAAKRHTCTSRWKVPFDPPGWPSGGWPWGWPWGSH